MKTCSKCKADKDESDFNYKDKQKGKLQSYCKKCGSDMTKLHYTKNKQYYVDKAYKRRLNKRSELSEYKTSLACLVCGEAESVCLDFHHLGDKLHSIANM